MVVWFNHIVLEVDLVLITKELLWNKYNISEEQIENSGLSLEELNGIENDFREYKYNKYLDIMKEFIENYLENTEAAKIHSYRARVKDPEHLAVKIIRRKQSNYKKYKRLNENNYEKFVTDLIGVRCFILFKSEWENFHQFVLSHFENNVEYYITDCISDFDEDEKHNYIAEKPKVHIRSGDVRDIYEKILPPDCVVDDKIYRSVHYILKYKGVYLEIQVRTLFEEGWGEVDHAIRYPNYQADPIFKEYTELLNRLSGLADEMGSFFNKLENLELEYLKKKRPDTDIVGTEEYKKDASIVVELKKRNQVKTEDNKLESGCTPNDCVQSVLNE